MYKIRATKQYQKDLLLVKQNSYGTKTKTALTTVLKYLQNGQVLPPQYKDHELKAFGKDVRECHIRGDLVLVYKYDNDELILYLLQLGKHSKIF